MWVRCDSDDEEKKESVFPRTRDGIPLMIRICLLRIERIRSPFDMRVENGLG